MSTTKKVLAKAAYEATGSKTIFVNSKEECFTSENLALLSDKKENIETFNFSDEADKAKEQDEVKAAKAKDSLLKKIEAAKTAEAAQALLAGYEEDETVKQAVANKVKTFAAAPTGAEGAE